MSNSELHLFIFEGVRAEYPVKGQLLSTLCFRLIIHPIIDTWHPTRYRKPYVERGGFKSYIVHNDELGKDTWLFPWCLR